MLLLITESLTCMQTFGHANHWLAMKRCTKTLTLLLFGKIQKENILALNTQ